MTLFKPPGLDKANPIVNSDGRPSVYFQRFWQNLSFTAADGGQAGQDLTGKVDKNTSAGWSSATGTGSKATFLTFTSPVIGAGYSQAQVQAMADHIQILSQHIKALTDALLAASVIST